MKPAEERRKPPFAKLKQRELADLLGVPEETICRELRLLKNNLKNELLWDHLNVPWQRIARRRRSLSHQTHELPC